MYGRARRLQFMQSIAIGVAIVVVIVLSVVFFTNLFARSKQHEDFKTLKNYMVQRGFACELLEEPGSACKYEKEGILIRFVRYEDGFDYNVSTDAYYIQIKHVKDEDKFVFRTTEDALAGYKKKIYYCKYNDSIIGTLKECVTENGQELDSPVYIGQIESAMNDISLLLKSSNYKVDKMINDYQWVE